MLLRAHELWRDTPGLLRHYRERFWHVLVDEFQDTNTLQYLAAQLVGDDGNLFVVGDDDQSISQLAPRSKTCSVSALITRHELIRLEQNYRSTGNILNAANALIATTPTRLGKELWTDGAPVEAITLYGGSTI